MILGHYAKLIRSKNAAPFMLTIDILFENEESYHIVKRSKRINKETISSIYQMEEDAIEIFECDEAMAIKISFPRSVSSGSRYDLDTFGGQQHGPLVELDI